MFKYPSFLSKANVKYLEIFIIYKPAEVPSVLSEHGSVVERTQSDGGIGSGADD